ncbi:MAG: hypothetical protein OEL78_05845 [Hyphomicrobiales bacterium]|jgi:hypothetical protein|nr:hypothetical protein [Hyphomicrobiales bacterium]
MEQLIIQLISGAVGGNVAGAAMKEDNPGVVYNSLAGMAGGGIGGLMLGIIFPALAAGGSLDIGSIIGNIAGGGVGGGVLMVIIGMIKRAMAK